jgi:hypothetical protein
LAECWYNSNFHTAIKVTPFEALYGYPPPQLGLGSIPRSVNQAINEKMAEKQAAARLLKEQLNRSQTRMKKYADSKSERKFHVGD